MTRLLVVTPDRVGPQMAGPAIRATEICRAAAADGHEVRLASHLPLGSVGLDTAHLVDDATAAEQAGWADVILIQGAALRMFPSLGAPGNVLVVDAYDPIHFERLARDVDDPPLARRTALLDSIDMMGSQLSRADFVICANEVQRHLWMGHMAAVGRTNPTTFDADPDLRGLIDVVGFGIPDTPPARSGEPGLRATFDAVGADDVVLLWAGGVYEWFDPLTVVDAVAELAPDHPTLRLVFMGLGHPNSGGRRAAIVDELLDRASRRGVLGTNVVANEGWVPYDRRQDFLLDADIGISAHRLSVETTYAHRTRMLDYLWAGLPMISTAGDGFAREIEGGGWGAVVDPGDVTGLASSIAELVTDVDRRRAAAAAVSRARDRYRWSATTEPLRRFLEDPRPAPDRRDGPMWEAVEDLRPRPASRATLRIRAVRRVVRLAQRDGVGLAARRIAGRVAGRSSLSGEEL